MIPIRQFDALLQTQSLNNKMFQTLVQGSEDTAIKATIQQDGKNIQIDKRIIGSLQWRNNPNLPHRQSKIRLSGNH